MNISVQQLWEDFLYYQSCTGNFKQKVRQNPYVKTLKATPERLSLMAALKQWCLEQGVPARQWLYSLFAARHWLYSPQLKLGHLCSKNHLPKFAIFNDYDLYTHYLQNLAQHNTKNIEFDPNRDISYTAEEAKRYYVVAGRVDLCMEQTSSETFGYHPMSRVCIQCSLQKECEARLQNSVHFDIGALRRGEITAEQAYNQTLVQVLGYGR